MFGLRGPSCGAGFAGAVAQFETENVLADAAMFGAVGVGFTQTEWYNIMLTIKQLGEDPVKLVKTVRSQPPAPSRKQPPRSPLKPRACLRVETKTEKERDGRRVLVESEHHDCAFR